MTLLRSAPSATRMPISRWRFTTAYASIACRPDSSNPLAMSPSRPIAATANRYGNNGSAVSCSPVADDRIGRVGRRYAWMIFWRSSVRTAPGVGPRERSASTRWRTFVTAGGKWRRASPRRAWCPCRLRPLRRSASAFRRGRCGSCLPIALPSNRRSAMARLTIATGGDNNGYRTSLKSRPSRKGIWRVAEVGRRDVVERRRQSALRLRRRIRKQ